MLADIFKGYFIAQLIFQIYFSRCFSCCLKMQSDTQESEYLSHKFARSKALYPKLQRYSTDNTNDPDKNTEKYNIFSYQQATNSKTIHGPHPTQRSQPRPCKDLKNENSSTLTIQDSSLQCINNTIPFKQPNNEFLNTFKRVPSNLNELNLSGSSLDYVGISFLARVPALKTLKSLNLSNNPIGDAGIQLLMKTAELEQLQTLNLSRTYFGEIGAKSIGQNCNWRNISHLNLSENHIGSKGIKFLSESGNWNRLEVLILGNVMLDKDGAKFLAENESWRSLKELYLNNNSTLDDFGAAHLTCNKSWMNLKLLSLCGCNVGSIGLEHLKRNRIWRLLNAPLVPEADLKERCEKNLPAKNPSAFVYKQLDRYSIQLSDSRRHQSILKFIGRGGGSADSEDFSGLIVKLRNYSKRVLEESDLQQKFRYYIQTRGRYTSKETEPFELSFEIKTKFLKQESDAKVLLLTGESGIGKSYFCQYFQRSLLLDWSHYQETMEDQEMADYLPIFVPLALLNEPNTAAISESLKGELKLDQNEIQQLRSNAGMRGIPRLLFLFDGYEDVCGQEIKSTKKSFNPMNFYLSNKILEEWNGAKVIITYQEEALTWVKQKELLFAPIDKIIEKPFQNSLMEVKLERFSDEEIKTYLRKYAFFNNLKSISELDKGAEPLSPDSRTLEWLSLKTWDIVEEWEKAINHFKIRNLLRVPYLLSASVNVLPEIVEMSKRQLLEAETEEKGNKSPEDAVKNLEIEVLKPESSAKSFGADRNSGNNEGQTQRMQKLVDIQEEEKEHHLVEEIDDLMFVENVEHEQMNGHAQEVHQNQGEGGQNQENDHEGNEMMHVENNSEQGQEEGEEDNAPGNIQWWDFLANLLGHNVNIGNQQQQQSDESSSESSSEKESEHSDLSGNTKPRLSSSELYRLITDSIIKSEVEKHISSQQQRRPTNSVSSEIFETNIKARALSHALALQKYTNDLMLEEPAESDEILVSAGFLRRVNFAATGFHYLFTHTSLQDFFIAGSMISEILEISEEVESFDETTLRLNTRLLDLQSPLATFLVDEIAEKPQIQAILFRLVGFSKTNPRCCIAAANAVSLLNLCKANFNGHDFSGVKIMNADLSYAELEDVVFNDADLRGVNFTKSYLVDAEMIRANLDGVIFGAPICLEMKAPISSLEYSRKNKFVAAVIGPELVLFENDPETGSLRELKRIYKINSTDNLHCAISPDEKLLATAGHRNGSILIWDIESEKCIATISGPKGPAMMCKFSPNNKHLLSVYLYNGDYWLFMRLISDGDLVFAIERAHTARINTCSFDATGRKFLTASNDGKIGVWNADGRRIGIIPSHHAVITCSFSPDGTQIVSANMFAVISIWNSSTLQLVRSFKRLSHAVSHLSFSFDAQQLLIITNQMAVLDLATGKPLLILSFEGSSDSPTCYAFSSDTRYMLTGGNDKIIRVWDLSKLFKMNKKRAKNPKREGLSLEETNIESAKGLSNDNLLLFKEIGVYSELSKEDIRRIVLGTEIVKKIDLSGQEATGLGATVPISYSQILTELEELRLAGDQISGDAAYLLSQNKTWSNLKILDLSRNTIDWKGCEGLASNTTWVHLENLDLGWNHIGDGGATALAKNEVWVNLKRLVLNSNRIRDEGAVVIGEKNTWPQLEELLLYHNKIGDKGAAAIGSNETWKKLRILNLSHNEIEDEGGRVLGSNKSWTSLEELNLSANTIANQSAVAIANNAAFTNLKVLSLENNKIDDEGAEVICNNQAWNQLEEVYLYQNNLQKESLTKMETNPHWKNLKLLIMVTDHSKEDLVSAVENDQVEVLVLIAKNLGDVGGIVIGRTLLWLHLRDLFLSNNDLGDKSIEVLARNTHWHHLKIFNISKNRVTDVGCEALARNQTWKKLEIFDVRENKIGDAGAVAIAGNTTWRNLQLFLFTGNKISDTGSIAIGANTTWSNLTGIEISESMIGDAGAAAIGSNSTWTRMKKFDFSYNKIGDEGSALISRSNWIHLKELDLSFNQIGDRGAVELGKNTSWHNLNRLYLRSNKIGDGGCAGLARNEIWTELALLDLSMNQIGDQGAIELSKNTSFISLNELRLINNNIKDAGIAGIFSNKTWVKLQELYFEPENTGGIYQLLNDSAPDEVSFIRLMQKGLSDIYASLIAQNTSWVNLSQLVFRENKFTDESGVLIGKNRSWTKLEVLDLCKNAFGDRTVQAMAEDNNWDQLKLVTLGNNKIGDEGGIALGKITCWTLLKMLDISDNEIGDKGAAAIGKNTSWKNMNVIDFSGNKIGDEGGAVIGSNTAWEALTVLDISNNRLGDKALLEIGSNTAWKNLLKLKLRANRIGNDGGVMLATNTAWTNLEELHLHQNHIGDKFASQVASNTSWEKLKALNFGNNRIGDEGAASIGRNTTWSNLILLNLSANRIGDTGAMVVGQNTTWVNLEKLALNDNRISDKGAVFLGQNTSWINLEYLNLSINQIGDEGSAAIGSNSTWTKLKELSMFANRVGDQGAIAIGNNKAWVALKRLYLFQNEITDIGAIAIGGNDAWERLKALYLGNNKIGDEGCRAIGSNAHWPNMKILDLARNEIGYEAALAIGCNPAWVYLRVCSLGYSKISDEGGMALGINMTWKHLVYLDLPANQIGDSGATAIGNNETWNNLLKINLFKNNISDVGGVAIAKNTNWSRLGHLDLSSNKIGDKTAVAIANNATWTNLEELWLTQNFIGDEGASAIGSNKTWNKLKKLGFSQNKIGDTGGLAIASNTVWEKLEEIYLDGNGIQQPETRDALKANITWKNIKRVAVTYVQLNFGDSCGACQKPLAANEPQFYSHIDKIYFCYACGNKEDGSKIGVEKFVNPHALVLIDVVDNKAMNEVLTWRLRDQGQAKSIAEEYEMKVQQINCSACQKFLHGSVQWKCLNCWDVDLCNQCFKLTKANDEGTVKCLEKQGHAVKRHILQRYYYKEAESFDDKWVDI